MVNSSQKDFISFTMKTYVNEYTYCAILKNLNIILGGDSVAMVQYLSSQYHDFDDMWYVAPAAMIWKIYVCVWVCVVEWYRLYIHTTHLHL